jgi:hypothetical protein
VTVVDSRNAMDNTWTANVSSTSFTAGSSTINKRVATSNLAYSSGAATSTQGNGTFTGRPDEGQAPAAPATSASRTRTMLSPNVVVLTPAPDRL